MPVSLGWVQANKLHPHVMLLAACKMALGVDNHMHASYHNMQHSFLSAEDI